MGAQPDTSTSAPDVWHGIQQILAQIPVAAHLATYLALLWQFFRFHRYRLRFAFPIRNSYPTDIPRKVPLNCQSSVSQRFLGSSVGESRAPVGADDPHLHLHLHRAALSVDDRSDDVPDPVHAD